MRSLAEVGADGREVESLAGAVEIRGDHSDFCRDVNGAAVVRSGAVVFERIVVEAEHRHSGANHIHRRGVLWSGFEKIHHGLRQLAGRAKFVRKRRELFFVREFAVPEQVGHLLEGRLAGDLVDVVAGVDQNSLVSQHIAEVGGVGDDSFESFGNDG